MKKFLSILCAVSMLVSLVNVSFARDDEWEAEYPKIIFENKTEVMKVKAGETIDFTVVVKNVGDQGARYITITNSEKDAPIYWETAVDTYTIYRMSTGTKKEVNMSLKVKETADVGTYALPFNITYSNGSGTEYSNKQTLYFEVVKEYSKPLIIVRNIVNNPETVTADSENKLSFELYNSGDLDARRVKLTLKGMSKDGFMVKDAIDNRYFDIIEGKGSKKVDFDLLVSENIVKGTNTLDVDLHYFDQDNKEYTDTKTIYINNVQGSEGDSGKGIPKIIVSSYRTNPDMVIAGRTVSFDFTIKNTHTTKTIKNMKAVVDSEDGTFTLDGGSNSFYVGELKAQEEISRSFTLRAKADALSRAYPVSITFDYEDADGNAHNATEKINIPVVEKTELSIDNISGPYEMYLGNTGSISFEYYNKGKATVSNLSVTVDGDYSPVNATNYVGNVEAGGSGYSEIEIKADVAGNAKGNIIFSFEDSSGNVKTITKPIEGTVYEDMPAYDPGTDDMPVTPTEPETEQMEWWKLTLIGLGAFLLTTVIVRFITIKIMMRRLEDEI